SRFGSLSACLDVPVFLLLFYFFFVAPAPTALYTLSLHDALPISSRRRPRSSSAGRWHRCRPPMDPPGTRMGRRLGRCRGETHTRSEEHTSELQSRENLVCRLLLEKKKKKDQTKTGDSV